MRLSWAGRSVAVIAAAAVVSGSLIVPMGAGAQEAEQPVSGGRVVFALAAEPSAGLNQWLVCCTGATGVPQIARILMPHAYVQGPDFVYRPHVLEEEAEVTTDPFTITYRIKPEAAWDDGMPVSARDFVFTWRTFTKARNQIATREGYDLIESATVVDPKTVTFTFRKPYSAYKRLFADVFPRHVLRGENFNRVWNRSIPISAGPFRFGEYEVGDRLTLVRNENYWGEQLAYLDEVEFRFIRRAARQAEALRTGEVDAIYPSVDPRLSQVYDLEDAEVQTNPSLLWEHLALGFRDRLIQKPFIRRTLALAIDREALVAEVIRPVDPDASVLDSLLLLGNEPGYEPHFDRYRYDPSAARTILEDHGCRVGGDTVWRCNGRRLAFEYTTTNDNPIRKHVAEVVRRQLEAFGIEVVVRRHDAAVVFGPRILVSGRFDIFNFAWAGSDLRQDRGIWACNGTQNFTRYCNEDVGALLGEAYAELDPTRQAQLANLADEVMADDMASLPLYQRPTFLAYTSAVHGMADNPTMESPTWNIEEWWVDRGS